MFWYFSRRLGISQILFLFSPPLPVITPPFPVLTPLLPVSPSLKMEAKTKGLKEQQQHHKKLLAAMLSHDSFDSVHSSAPSLTEEEIEDEDDAMELLGKVNTRARTDTHTLVCFTIPVRTDISLPFKTVFTPNPSFQVNPP